MGPSFPGQSGSWCGHAIHVASWGSHSAGMRSPGGAADGSGSIRRALVAPNCPTGPTSPVPEMSCRTSASDADVAVEDRAVRVDAAVAQERPVAPHLFLQRGVAGV